jgi:hypothetical protein
MSALRTGDFGALVFGIGYVPVSVVRRLMPTCPAEQHGFSPYPILSSETFSHEWGYLILY